MIAKTVDADGAGSGLAERIYTIYDGQHAWVDFDGSSSVVARYVFGNRTDESLARWQPSDGTAWYLTDHLGTVRDFVDDSGDLINTITYDSFGNILSQTDASAGDRFTYTGREYDAELDLYYYRARYYDPQLGRFVSQDPIGFAAGDANLYRYVGNNPLHYTDPSGNLTISFFGYFEINNVGTRILGFGQAVGGGLQAAGGTIFAVGTAETGVGAVVGGAVALKGVDNFQAGVRQIWTGQFTDTGTYTAVKAITGSEAVATLADIGGDLVPAGSAATVAKAGKIVDEGGTTGSKVFDWYVKGASKSAEKSIAGKIVDDLAQPALTDEVYDTVGKMIRSEAALHNLLNPKAVLEGMYANYIKKWNQELWNTGATDALREVLRHSGILPGFTKLFGLPWSNLFSWPWGSDGDGDGSESGEDGQDSKQ